jgi:hypothetical protein
MVVAVIVATMLAGCAGGPGNDKTVALTEGVPASATSMTAAPGDGEGADGVVAGPGTDGTEGTDGNGTEQTLPPGDPGADAPGTDDPNADLDAGAPDPVDAPAKTTVAASALLDTETVSSVAGEGWTRAEASRPVDACVRPVPAKSVASRAAAFERPTAVGQGSSRLLETVSTHADRKSAIAAVGAIGERLARCVDAAPTDPRVGDASVEATVTDAKGIAWTVTAVAVEGVSIVLSGSGGVAAPEVWAALTDIAQGNTCEAAPQGCH